jgi:type 1 glutamine amidotransferase
MKLILPLAALLGAQNLPDQFWYSPDKIQVLILSGKNNHEWRESTPFLRRILESTGRFEVRVTEEPAGLNAAVLRPYHVLVSDYCGPRWGPAAESAIESFVRDGKGLVAVHAASYPFGERTVLAERMKNTEKYEEPWRAWGDMIGAVWTENPRTGHGKRHVYEVQWADPAHPIVRGMAPFKVSDELYHRMRLKPGIHVIGQAHDAKEQDGTGEMEPLLWTVRYGKGRVFHTALGHDVAAMQAPGFMVSFARGVEWAATEKVALPPELSLAPLQPDALRLLVVTGGHDHEASFYAMFDRDPRFKVNVDPHPVAFRRDIRKDYDVLVLYDSVQELPDAQKKNLQLFVESGKGVVLLHHTIVDFQNWEWWWKEVMGGLYVLKPFGGMPASTYQHDVELEVRPIGSHPIVRGLPPMRLFDETYKNVWRHPQTVPLLETRHPTSDDVIGWISPYPHSRVVFLQPGHGREAHENPWYRRLVYNAIHWSAGRLK